MSFVMPAWRPRHDWLVEAVGSVLGQSGCDVELLVVDDGNEVPVADALAGLEDGRLRVLRVPHGGVSAARNAGLAAATGAFVRFVDADDVCPRDSTAILLARAAARPGCIAYGAVTLCDEALEPRWTMRCSLEGRVLLDCLLGRFTVRVPALLVPRDVATAAGAWDPSYVVSEDWEWALRALEHAPVHGGPEAVYLYRRHVGGATTDDATGDAGAARIIEAFFRRHPELEGTSARRRADASLLARRSRVQLSRGRWLAAAAPAVRSVLRDPLPLAEEAARSFTAARGAARHRLVPRHRARRAA